MLYSKYESNEIRPTKQELRDLKLENIEVKKVFNLTEKSVYNAGCESNNKRV